MKNDAEEFHYPVLPHTDVHYKLLQEAVGLARVVVCVSDGAP